MNRNIGHEVRGIVENVCVIERHRIVGHGDFRKKNRKGKRKGKKEKS